MHGTRSCRLSWKLPANLEDGEVYVYYSDSGVKGSWELRTPTPITGLMFFLDDKFVIRSLSITGYYRLLLVAPDGTKYPSKRLPIADYTTREEYGTANKIIQNEWKVARAAGGIPMFHCVAKTSGPYADNIDPSTGVEIGAECPDDDDPSYGQLYKGGYYPPFLTWVRLLRVDIDNTKDNNIRLGSTSIGEATMRLLSFPRPAPGHMFVDPRTDNRWVIKQDGIRPFLIRGFLPVAYEVDVLLLQRNDPRYKFEMPDVDLEAFRKSPDYYYTLAREYPTNEMLIDDDATPM